MRNLSLITTAWADYCPVSVELSHFQPELVFLALGITTFYRKSFSFQVVGPLVLTSLLTSLCLRLHSSPLTASLAAALTLILAARVGSYDGQDVINNLVMYAYLTQRPSLTQPTLWWAILFLSPAQLIR